MSIKKYYTDIVDRAIKSAAQGAILSIGVESVEVNAMSVDYALMGGMALGAALLSLLTNVAQRGLFGKGEAPGS